MKKRYIICFFALVFVVSFAGAQVEKIVNGGFEGEDISMWGFQGGTPATMERSTVDPISGTASIKVTITTANADWWRVQLVQLFGINVKKYTISFKARASSDVTIVAKIQENHPDYRDIASSNLNLTTTAQTFTFSANNLEVGYDPDAKFTIGLGNIPVGTEFWFDDISVIETKADGDMVTNGDFEGTDVSMWIFQTGGSGAATLERSTESPMAGAASLKVTITNAGTAGWHIQLCQLFGFLKDKKYTVTLTARASIATTIETKIQQNHDPYATLGTFDNALTTEAKTFSKAFNNYELANDPDGKLTIWLGNGTLIPTGTIIWFDNISIIESAAPPLQAGLKYPGEEKIANGFFEEGTTGWAIETGGTGAATYTVSTTTPIQGAQSGFVQITSPGTSDWHVQLKQNLSVKADKRYYILYKAKASVNNIVFKAGIQQTSGSYPFLTSFKAETLMTTVKTFFDSSGYMASDVGAKFTLLLGNSGTYNVWIDEVTIIENTMAAPLNFVMDGEKDDWYNQLTNPDDGKIFLPARAHLRDVGTAATWPQSNATISATIWTAWDRNYLYYYVDVNDEYILCNNATNWNNDKFEVKYNPDPTIISTSGALQVGMSALGAEDVQHSGALDNLDADLNLYFANKTLWNPTFDDYAREIKDGGYILEFRIPIIAMNNATGTQKLYAGVGGKFGVAINLADNDDIQRTRMLQWSAGMADIAWANPQKHGTVHFLADNKLKWEAKNAQDPTVVNDSASIWYYGALGPTSVPKNDYLPGVYTLGQNYPNPFNPTTTIEFSVPKKGEVRLVLVNILGQVVKEIVKADYTAGVHKVELNASQFASGVYFYRMTAGSFTDVKKLVLLK